MPDPASKKKSVKYDIEFLCEGNIEAFPWKVRFETMARKLLREEGCEKTSLACPISRRAGRGSFICCCFDDFV